MKKYGELQEIPKDLHLLCPKVSKDDEEDYRRPRDDSTLSLSERKQRIQDGDSRVELTYWNSLVLGFDRKEAGKWGEEFRNRLDETLKLCPECVLNWHMKRQMNLQKFAE